MESKVCPDCHQDLPVDNFSKNAKKVDGLQSLCKVCKKGRQDAWYVKNKASHASNVSARKKKLKNENDVLVYNYLLSHPCVDCTEADPIVLEFDHVRGEKKGEVSEMVIQGHTWKLIQEEIDKCDVRCANCHKRKTSKERNSFRHAHSVLLSS